MDRLILNEMIEQLRSQLIELVAAKGDFVDDEVVALSEKLDILICRYWQEGNKQALIA